MRPRDLLNTRDTEKMQFLAARVHRDAMAAERRAQERTKGGKR